jgi:N-acetylmuramoyl-L-alanine amidase
VAAIRATIANVLRQGGEMPPLNMTKGLIPLPPIVDDIIDVSRRDQSLGCRGYDDLGPRPTSPEFLVLHRSQCPPEASNGGFFHQPCCPALTDLEVIASTGQMRRFVRLNSRIAGWANGVVSSPYGDGLAWLNHAGGDLNTVNRDGESVEITGFFRTPDGEETRESPVSEAAWTALAQWIASRAHDHGIPWDQFPAVRDQNGRSYLIWHQEFTIGTGKICPGKTVIDFTPTLIERARAIMKAAQEGTAPGPDPVPPPTKFAPVDKPDWLDDDLRRGQPADHPWKGTTAFACLRQYEAVKETRRRQTASAKAKEVGPPLKPGDRFTGWYVFSAGRRHWVMTPFGSRILMSDLKPRVRVSTE